LNIFINKKILIYGLGKSGKSTYNFLKNKSNIFLYDDNKLRKKSFKPKKKFIKYKDILRQKFDFIIISPGIDIDQCFLSKFLKKNREKIYSDLDVFYEFYKNDCITITGTNGKSTTCQILYEVLLDQDYDVRLVGNIGNPILSVKKINSKTILVVEASSYQLEYSKIFKSKYAAILNLSPDHIERHKTFQKYVIAKFKLLKSQLKGHLAFVKKGDPIINKQLKLNKFESDGVVSSIYFDGRSKNYYVKRFKIETITMNKKFCFISQEKGSKLEFITYNFGEIVTYKYYFNKKLKTLDLDLDSFIDVKGWKSIGNKILTEKIRSGSFKFKERLEAKKPDDEKVNESDNKENNNEENFEVGESIELDLDSDQLNLFNEKD